MDQERPGWRTANAYTARSAELSLMKCLESSQPMRIEIIHQPLDKLTGSEIRKGCDRAVLFRINDTGNDRKEGSLAEPTEER